jgi:hypothetical protein
MSDSVARQSLKLMLYVQRANLKPSQRNKPLKRVKWAYPTLVERKYAALIKSWVKPMITFTQEFLKQRGEAMLRGDSADIRVDALPGGTFVQLTQSLKGWAAAYLPDNPGNTPENAPSLFMGLSEISEDLFIQHKKQWDKQCMTGIGVKFPDDENWWAGTKANWAQTNYTLVKSMTNTHITLLNSLAEKAVVNGWGVKMLSDEIGKMNRKLTDSKVNLLARDQIGKLNGMATQARMESIGLSMYLWDTSGDERVRPSHAVMDGKLCRWDNATVYSDDAGKTWKPRPVSAVLLHPGMDIQCRCIAMSYWNELVGEVDAKIAEHAEPETASAKTPQKTVVSQSLSTLAMLKPNMKPKTIEDRFGKKFDSFLRKSMQYIDSNEPIPDNIKKELELALKRFNKTPDQYIAEVNAFIAKSNIVRHDILDNFLDNIDSFEKDPRIKTQFETGTSQGALSKENRNFWERRLIGKAVGYDYPPRPEDKKSYGIVKTHRPVYAEVTSFHPLDGNASGGYGEMSFVMSNTIRERTSFSLDNSSVDGIGSFKKDAGSIFSKPGINVRQNVNNFYSAQREGGYDYIEAQTWGGIDLSKGDVKAVVIEDRVFIDKAGDKKFERFLKTLKDNGVEAVKRSEWK